MQYISTMHNLAAQVQHLPAELFDEIHHRVFTALPDTIPITHSYRPPALLQVDRASRKQYAATYYGNGNIFISSDLKLLAIWFGKLDRKHKALVQKVIFTGDEFCKTSKVPFDPNELRSTVLAAPSRAIGYCCAYPSLFRTPEENDHYVELEMIRIWQTMASTK